MHSLAAKVHSLNGNHETQTNDTVLNIDGQKCLGSINPEHIIHSLHMPAKPLGLLK